MKMRRERLIHKSLSVTILNLHKFIKKDKEIPGPYHSLLGVSSASLVC
jgi:hypothetical protein